MTLPSGSPSRARRFVDRLGRASYVAPLAFALFATAACASAGTSPGAPDPALEARLATATVPGQRLQVLFDWNMTDRDARFSGRGVLRLENGRRGRVDLFGPRGETLAAAIVEDNAMRIVPEAARGMLPPPTLLWATLGVFRIPEALPLTGSAAAGESATLDYGRDETRWRFTFEGDRLRTTEWTDGAGRRTVVLSGTAEHGLPAQAVFRDWTEFRELTLRVTEVEERAAFEPDVWILPGER
jgi:hypothetical protein